jgi:hypothetical protein
MNVRAKKRRWLKPANPIHGAQPCRPAIDRRSSQHSRLARHSQGETLQNFETAGEFSHASRRESGNPEGECWTPACAGVTTLETCGDFASGFKL